MREGGGRKKILLDSVWVSLQLCHFAAFSPPFLFIFPFFFFPFLKKVHDYWRINLPAPRVCRPRCQACQPRWRLGHSVWNVDGTLGGQISKLLDRNTANR